MALGLLGACSYVPDALNPVEWYKGMAGWFEDEEERGAAEVAKAGPVEVPGAQQSFPTLADVPEKPVPMTTVEERRRLMQGLAGDREHARYLDEVGPEPTAAPEAEAGLMPPSRAVPAPPPAVPPPSRIAAAPGVAGVPPPPPAPKAVPRAPVEAEAAGAPPAGPAAGSVDEMYQAKLQQSAPTVTTAPVGPTAEGTGAPMEPSAALGARSLEEFEFARSFLSAQVGTVLFAHGSAVLSPAGRKALRDIAQMHKKRGGTVRVIGHASSRTGNMDPVRHQLANFSISVRRADVVARELMRLGVKPGKIFVGARSDSNPIYYESMPAGEAGNRRAEIFVDY
jgi:flagellar motor protein MotB